MLFSLKTLAFVVTAIAMALGCIVAIERMATDHLLVALPISIVSTFAYMVFGISLLHVCFDQRSKRPFYGGVSLALLLYFAAKPLEISYDTQFNAHWWNYLFQSKDITTAARCSEIVTVTCWILAAVCTGIYIQCVAKPVVDAG